MFLSWGSHSVVYVSDYFSTHILYRTDMLLYFFIGYFYALNGFPIPKLGRYSVFVVMVFLGVIGLFVSMYLSGFNPDGYDFVNIRFLFSMAFILAIPTFFSFITLNLNSVFVRVLRFLSPYSFTIFFKPYYFIKCIFIFCLQGFRLVGNRTIQPFRTNSICALLLKLGLYVCLFRSKNLECDFKLFDGCSEKQGA